MNLLGRRGGGVLCTPARLRRSPALFHADHLAEKFAVDIHGYGGMGCVLNGHLRGRLRTCFACGRYLLRSPLSSTAEWDFAVAALGGRAARRGPPCCTARLTHLGRLSLHHRCALVLHQNAICHASSGGCGGAAGAKQRIGITCSTVAAKAMSTIMKIIEIMGGNIEAAE